MGDRTVPHGIVGAVLTPFNEAGDVDGEALEREIDFQVGHCDALSVFGAEASEYQILRASERRKWLVHATEMVGRRRPVMAGASSPAWSEVVELSELAASAGADFVQVLMPRRAWGGEPSTSEVVAYFEAVAERSALPVVAYHNPVRGADPSPDAFVTLAEIERVVGFKESSRDIAKIGSLIEEIDVAGRARYLTTMQPLLTTLMLGGSGAMMPPPATLIGAQVVAAHRERDYERAVTWQRCFSTFPTRWRSYGLAPVMKSAMRHLGVDIGGPAEPFEAVSDQDDAAIGRFLDACGIRHLLSATA